MRRLKEAELEARISNFLARKSEEFPDLAIKDSGSHERAPNLPKPRHLNPRIRWEAV